jgi:SAM-dependent methyltransferase
MAPSLVDHLDAAARLFPEKSAGGFSRHCTTVEFYTRVNALLRPEMTVLDHGAGRGGGFIDEPRRFIRELRNLRGKVRWVVGVDLDPIVAANPILDEAHVLPPAGSRLPLEDRSIDLIISDWTFEHIDDPTGMAAEFHRILRPGGWVCARTPNKWGYIALGNRLLPDRLHAPVLRRLQPAREERDVFPTRYRLNTRGALCSAFPVPDWSHHSYAMAAEPTYAGSSLPLAQLLMLDRYLPEALRPVLLCFLRRR